MNIILNRKDYLELIYSHEDTKTLMRILTKICDQNINFKGISYARIYNNQSCFIISNHQEWFPEFLLYFNEFDNTVFEQKLQESSVSRVPLYAIWNYIYNDTLLSFDHEFDIDVGFDVYVKHKGYVEVLGIAGDKFCTHFHNFSINNLSKFHNILKQIRDAYKELKIKYRCNLPIKIDIPGRTFYTISSGKKIFFTDREFECVNYILKGYTFKDIAQEINISPRTVEGHILSIKKKLNVQFKSQMIKKLTNENGDFG